MGKPRKSARSIAAKAAVFLLLGAAVNIAVAWGCASYSPTTGERSIEEHAWPVKPPRTWPGTANHGWKHEGIGLSVCSSRTFAEEWRDNPLLLGMIDFKAGWPTCSMRWTLYDTVERGTLDYWPDKTHGAWTSGLKPLILTQDQWRFQRRLPIAILWPGFAVNTLLYAAILWLLFAAPFALRRRQRIMRGLCPACAYPVGASEVCTECGRPVRPRGRRACAYSA